MPVDSALTALIHDRRPVEEIRCQAIKKGMKTLREDGITKLKNGETSPAEVIRESA